MVFRKYFLLIVLCFVVSCLFSREASSFWRRGPKRPTPAQRKRTLESRKKKYRYIRSHDLNHDGKVDQRDRLLWLKKHRGSSGTIYVSTENEDLMDVMDMNGDGDVDSSEMEEFYDMYDLNGNGVLEDDELEAAVD